jgi:hypothetical protein
MVRSPNDAAARSLVDADDERSSLLGGVPDAVRKMLVAGVGALFMTEEGIRSLVKDLKLPKEAIGFVVAQADKTKTEVTRVVSTELRKFLESTRLRDELVALLGQLTFEVHAQIQVRRREPNEPPLVTQVRVQRGEKSRKAPARKRPQR